jgi:hypothetical protein
MTREGKLVIRTDEARGGKTVKRKLYLWHL